MNNKFKTQLFLLHFAGGSCYSFDFLKPALNQVFDFLPLELPGRGKRIDQVLLDHKAEAIQDYIKQIQVLRNGQPYLVYGHSMGATLGLSVVKGLELINDPPMQLIVSGNAGPGAKEPVDPLTGLPKVERYLMNDAGFKDALRELGGVPELVLTNEELYAYFSPIIRADFAILEKDELYEKDTCIETPVYALMGDQEKTVEQIENWKSFTSGEFTHQVLPGNHFFIHQHSKQLADLIKDCSETFHSNTLAY